MKTIFCALLSVVFFFGAKAQSDLGLLSTYVDKLTPTEEAPQCLKQFEDYLQKQDVMQQLTADFDGQIVETLGALFHLKDPSSYLTLPSYRSLLEDYESAPACADFSVHEVIEYAPEVMRTDYKLTKAQVIFIDQYAAIDDTAPFNNQDAIENAFDVITDVKGLAIVTVTFDNRYSADLMGNGGSTIVADVTIRIYNKKGKGIFGKNATGISSKKINLSKEKEYSLEEIKPVFEEALNNALLVAQNELPKSIKKIRW